jgi:periplasmic divalent cation tolerance protein
VLPRLALQSLLWQSEFHDTSEARVALHTRMSLVDLIIERTNQEHPYLVPCVIAVPIVAGNAAYRQWIVDETRGGD